ncbi:MAG: glycoside hydrolase family 92 protein, partial [Bacteroidales bacterium]|nr:glycoside hydrolase family 92 protein [Bacteroidales bacterium]
GEAWKTQKLVNQILTELHSATPGGLSGNDDCGQMSAWYILSSLGFYSVTPGQNIYVIGSPLFEKATINLENGNKFIVKANNISAENIYIQSATLNGEPYINSYLLHEDIMRGAELLFEMGPEPNKKWGAAKNNRPYSENGDPVVSLPFIKSGDRLFLESTEISLGCDTKDTEIRYTLDGSVPTEKAKQYTNPFKISESHVIKIRAFHKDLKPGIPIAYKFNKAKLKEAVKIANVKPGLKYDYYERFFVTTEDLDTATPLQSGITDKITINQSQKANYFGFRFSGYIRVPKNGIYTFYLESNDGSRLFIDNEELIENDANHGAVEQPGSVDLKAGLHQIEVKYFQCGGGKKLKVSWAGPGFSKKEIGNEFLFHKSKPE